jgi:hypothetical protein
VVPHEIEPVVEIVIQHIYQPLFTILAVDGLQHLKRVSDKRWRSALLSEAT